MAYNVLQKTAGLKTVSIYVPDAPGYSPGSVPFPKSDNYSLPPISYDPVTDSYEAGGKYFETYESLNGYIMSSLWVQQGGIGYGYEQGFVALGIEQADDSDFVSYTMDLTDSGVNPYLAATQNGQVVTNLGSVVTKLSAKTYSSAVQVAYRPPTGYGLDMSDTGARLAEYVHEYTGVRPVTYSNAVQVAYRPPVGSGIDMSNTGDRLTSYVNTQFNKSSLFTL